MILTTIDILNFNDYQLDLAVALWVHKRPLMTQEQMNEIAQEVWKEQPDVTSFLRGFSLWETVNDKPIFRERVYRYTSSLDEFSKVEKLIHERNFADDYIRYMLPTNNQMWKDDPVPKCNASYVIDWCLLTASPRKKCMALVRAANQTNYYDDIENIHCLL